MLNVWGRAAAGGASYDWGPSKVFVAAYSSKGLRAGWEGRGTWAHGTHETLRRLRVSFDSESREAGSGAGEDAGNGQLST